MSDQQTFSRTIDEFLASDARFMWFVADDVYFGVDERQYFCAFEANDAELLSTLIEHTTSEALTMSLALWRLGRRAAAVLRDGLARDSDGSPRPLESLLPTLVQRENMLIQEIGGSGPLTPPDRSGRRYDERTWRTSGQIEHVPGMLHHPAPVRDQPLASGRITPADQSQAAAKLLYVSPVGRRAASLLPKTLAHFLGAGADCLLLQYEELGLALPEEVRVINDVGHKWQLALRHLSPDTLAAYDFVFFWDDDIEIKEFDPRRFVEIMRCNALEAAQPAVESLYPLSHEITGQMPCPPPWRMHDADPTYSIVGRLTNFVEIMVPVFSARAWREIYGYLQPDNVSGWGYDLVPLGRRGIVDVLPVEHTRPVQSPGSDPNIELDRFCHNQGLSLHEGANEGWLFEPWNAERPGRGAGGPRAWRPEVTSAASLDGRGYRAIRA
jgi:hypothetical protein